MTASLWPSATSDALLSPDGQYRYWLSRVWDEALVKVVFVALNPSTADASVDDPTIRRMVGFARSCGYGGLVVVNLFALRSTDPRALRRHHDPVGPENDRHLSEQTAGRDVIAAWGTCGTYKNRDRAVVKLIGRESLKCLGWTVGGHPKHPLYLPGGLRPVPLGPPDGVADCSEETP